MKTLLKYQKSQFIIKENVDGNTKIAFYCYSIDEALKRLKFITGNSYTSKFLESLQNGQVINL